VFVVVSDRESGITETAGRYTTKRLKVMDTCTPVAGPVPRLQA